MSDKKVIFVAGGAGYIGSHMTRLLLEEGFKPIVFDNLSTGFREFVPKEARFVRGDLRRERDIENALERYRPSAVMHFAAALVVPESVSDPLKYYENNVAAAITLLRAMRRQKVKRIIFSSTAAVYGEPQRIPVREDNPACPVNPYGRSKLMIEAILKDTAYAYPEDFRYISLRYFNVAGAHPAGGIGQKGPQITHLIPNILRAAMGSKKLTVFGKDWPTPDGTCIRDYIHVVDLCQAHLLALKAFDRGVNNEIFNLGSSKGFSVKAMIRAVEQVTGKKVPHRYGPRRPGDPARLIASSKKAREILGWRPRYGLDEIIETAWQWENR